MNDGRTPLGRVIDAAQHENGWSLNQLGERAKELGLKGLTKSNISNLKREQQQQISTNTLKNLAVLIRVPERVIVEAAIRSTNLEYPERTTAGATEAIANDLHLSARDKRILLAAISAMREEVGDGDAEATPLSEAGGTPAPGGIIDRDNPTSGEDDGAGDVHHIGERRRISPEKMARIEELQRRGDAATDEEIDTMAAYEPDED
ncbi:hypothetical protein [Brevibacterium sp.]|uniref:hypothetical protein n=1 Tax=Brevibacterium sp. TaxID=1701 RepID=UPI00281111BA|nr:hypothetical protein [Brevibacterium sp.]